MSRYVLDKKISWLHMRFAYFDTAEIPTAEDRNADSVPIPLVFVVTGAHCLLLLPVSQFC
jgi:hypothetical protein